MVAKTNVMVPFDFYKEKYKIRYYSSLKQGAVYNNTDGSLVTEFFFDKSQNVVEFKNSQALSFDVLQFVTEKVAITEYPK